MNLMLKMARADDLTPSERQVVKYILENPEDATRMKMNDLSKHSYTSNSTVLRLVRKLGLDSYIDFRVKLAEDIFDYLKAEALTSNEAPIEYDSSTSSIINNVTAMNTIAIKSTLKFNDEETFEAVTKLMHKYPIIDFYGIGHSRIIAQDAVIKSLRLGIHATLYDDDGSQIIASKIANKERLAFVISYTGETATTLKIANNLLKAGTPTVSFTSNTKNSLMELCNFNFFVDTTDSIYAIGHMSSRMAFLNIFDILFTVFANLNYQDNMDMLKKTYTYKRKEDED